MPLLLAPPKEQRSPSRAERRRRRCASTPPSPLDLASSRHTSLRHLVDEAKDWDPRVLVPPSPTDSTSSYRARPLRRPFHDPYASRWARMRLLLEVNFALSMMQDWEKGLFVAITLLVLVLMAGALYGLPASVLFIASRLRYYASGAQTLGP
ncbi:hypothetical protein CALCODRAFT_479427 [Calocera cornea HHB12733]|uniref:Uncharacterized protein n=1 Tax=Calocera cornea HHB12733 TaxID=1353952 RepID=A0A165JJR5_9BASI|nr:hypothetical protein CALCODRAFT_479427 [Calocera cornea HHB12733]